MKLELIFLIIFYDFVSQLSDAVKIGGIFDDTQEAEIVYNAAILSMNNQRGRHSVQILGTSKKIPYGNEFTAAQTVCKMIENGAVGIIGPSSPESASHVRSICDAKEIPLIEIEIDGSSKHVINLHPTPEDLGRVYLDMINSCNWQGFTIIYQDAPWLPLIQYILKNYQPDFTVTIRQLDITSNANYRPQLRRVKQSNDKKILLCSSIEALPEILKQAQQVGLMTDEHHFIITTLDMHTIDLEPFQHSGTNITGFRLVSPNDPMVEQVTDFFRETYYGVPPDRNDRQETYYPANDRLAGDVPNGLTAKGLQLKSALIYDGVMLFSQVMSQHRGIHSGSILCDDRTSTFVNGTSIFNSMKTVPPYKGLSGEVQFDQHGNRENFQLEVLELATDGLKQIGTWNSSKGIQTLPGKQIELGPGDPNILMNKTLIVLTVINPPYGMLKETSEKLTGNNQFEGFGIELIEKLSARLGFNYIFKLQEDGAYGSINNQTGEWDGMIRELREDRADLAITDLTITAERENGADFTMPFMDLGISILFERPRREDPELFSFMQPFSGDVWLCVVACFFLVTISLFVLGRLSPAEWDNPYPCIEEPEVLENQFSFRNSMWFSIGAVLQQGSEIAPKAPSTRIVASMWWFFTLIMVSSYTANLAAFLTIENPSPLIEGVKDLQAGKVEYGAKAIGSTISFFRDAESDDNYKKMYNYMKDEKNRHLLMATNKDGEEKASKGKYAFLMESSTIEYITQRNCKVVQVGGLLDHKGYGIAMKKHSPYRGALSEAVLQLKENGEIERMKTKWWKEKRGGGACANADNEKADDQCLTMKHVGGVFVVLAGGSGFAFVLGLFRWFVNIRHISKAIDLSFWEVLKEEFRFFRKFGTHVKPVLTRKTSSQLESVSGSNESRSRSSGNIQNGSNPISLDMSLRNINNVDQDEDIFEKND